MGRLLFMAFAAVIVVLIVLVVSKLIGKQTDEEAEKDFKRSLEDYKKLKELEECKKKLKEKEQ